MYTFCMSEPGGRLEKIVRKLFNKDGNGTVESGKTSIPKTEKVVPSLHVSRRALLQGTAAMAARPEKATSAIVSSALGFPTPGNMPPLPTDMVGRAAAELMPFVKLQLLLNVNDNTSVNVRKLDAEEHAESQMLADFLSKNRGPLPDADTVQSIGNAFDYIRSQNSIFPSTLQLANMQNPEVLATVYKLAGAAPSTQPGGEELQRLGRLLQGISGLSDSATIGEVNDVLLKKQRAYAGRVLTQIDSFEDVIERKHILQNIRLGLDGESQETSALIGRMLEKERELEPAYRTAMRERTQAEHRQRVQGLNESLESRQEIYCDISRISGTRASGKERSFRFRPVGYTPRSPLGLNRMNIEQYRQSLYVKAGKASEFVPAEPTVIENMDDPENGIVIETSDPLLIAELEKALTKGARVTIPDRLQIPKKHQAI